MIPKDVKNWNEQWKEVRFRDSIEVTGINRGRSAANFEAYSKTTNSFYTIFMTDLLTMMKAGHVNNCKITGLFEVKKRGRNFGVAIADIQKINDKSYCNSKSDFPIPGYC